MTKKNVHFLIQFLALLFCGLAVWLVYKDIRTIGWPRVTGLISTTPWSIMAIALILTAGDYLILSGYDLSALSFIRKKIPLLKVIKTAFISFSVTNTTGHAYIAGGSLRYMLYEKQGLTKTDVFKMIVFESLTYLLGMICVFDIALGLSGLLNHPPAGVPIKWFYIGAGIVTATALLYWAFIVLPERTLRLKRIRIPAPTNAMTGLQTLIGGTDIIAASLVFYTLVRHHLDVSFIHVFIIFTLAQLIGISTQVPGGLGVFESAFLYLFSHTPDEKAGLLAALISFRVVYYFIPLLLTGVYFLFFQTARFIEKGR